MFKVTVAVPAWINIAVPAGMLMLTWLAALVPAVRAGRLPAIQAITAGQAPRADHGHAAGRLAGRLPLPRPVTAGLAAPFTRPARSAATLATITTGLTAAVLAVGLSSQITKIVIVIGTAYTDRALFQRLTWLVVILAAIGVFSTLLTQARERVRDLGIHKAIGMTPRQVITMITCWAIAPAIIAGHRPARRHHPGTHGRTGHRHRAGRPRAKHRPPRPRRSPGPGAYGAIVQYTPHAQPRVVDQPPGGTPAARGLFAGMLNVAGADPYTPGDLILLALAGLAIALAGALGPAAWAAASRTTTALRAE